MRIGRRLQCTHHHLGFFSTTARHDHGGEGHPSALFEWYLYGICRHDYHDLVSVFSAIFASDLRSVSHDPRDQVVLCFISFIKPLLRPVLIFAKCASPLVKNILPKIILRSSSVALASRISLRPKAGELRFIMYRVFTCACILVLDFPNPCFREPKESRFARLLDSIANLAVSARFATKGCQHKWYYP